jgi:hypothetical protein
MILRWSRTASESSRLRISGHGLTVTQLPQPGAEPERQRPRTRSNGQPDSEALPVQGSAVTVPLPRPRPPRRRAGTPQGSLPAEPTLPDIWNQGRYHDESLVLHVNSLFNI